MMREVQIEVKDLVKNFGDNTALSGLSLEVRPGEIYGLLGPNGAGKTTSIKIVAAMLTPTKGQVRVLGIDPTVNPVEVKSKIGYVPENPVLYDSLTPREFFEFVTSVRKIPTEVATRRAMKLVQAFGVDQSFDSPISTLSMGTRQKIAVIASLIHEPPLLLMDEPLNGLDAKSSKIMKSILLYHTERGGSVLFSTHIMEIAEHICNRIGIIYQGRIVAEGTIEQLRGYVGEKSATLEEVFLKLTHEDSEVVDTVRGLRESLFKRQVPRENID
jgi:ABC-2 type transport system ATP-binding protein